MREVGTGLVTRLCLCILRPRRRMDRTTFEALRDMPEEVISGDVRFARRQALAPLLVAEGIRIENSGLWS